MINANTITLPMVSTLVGIRNTNMGSAAQWPKTLLSEATTTAMLATVCGELINYYLRISTKHRREPPSALFIGPTVLIDVDWCTSMCNVIRLMRPLSMTIMLMITIFVTIGPYKVRNPRNAGAAPTWPLKRSSRAPRGSRAAG